MSSIQEQLHTLLSGVASGGVFPMTAAQNASPPYVVYQRVAGTVDNVLAGNGSPPIANTRFQIDV
ncbi:MAG: tail completion protein gp17, partial [Solimonas sp.]